VKKNLLPKKSISWFFLISFFIFDNFFSYYAILFLGGREANLLIAKYVEKYPLLYFVAIPVTILIVYFIYYVMQFIARFFLNNKLDKVTIQKIVMATISLYWLTANSSVNIVYLLGFRIKGLWNKTMIAGLLISIIYAALMTRKEIKLHPA
jgi:hypothetical protein